VSAYTSLTHPDVVVLRRAGRAKPRVMYRVEGVEHIWGAHNNDLTTLTTGIMTRIMYVKGRNGHVPPPQPAPGVVQRLAPTLRRLKRTCAKLPPMSPEEFVSCYKGRKQRIYQEAAESVLRSPITPRDAVLSSFLKYEKINFKAKKNPDPRIINPRKPRYNFAVGRYIKRIEHRVYKELDDAFHDLGCTSRSVAKGLNFEQRAWMLRRKWLRFRRPRAIMLDCSRFDQHVRRQLLELEHQYYLAWFNGSDRRELAYLLRMQLRNKGVACCPDGIVKFTVDGMRASGDMNTALGNVFQVCLALLHLREQFSFEVADDGDDCVVMCEEEDLAALQLALVNLFTDMGHELRVDGVTDVFERIRFCQCQPVFDGHRWTMVRDPHISVSKDLTSTWDLSNPETFAVYMKTIGTAGLHLAGGIPVWDALYRRMIVVGGDAKVSDGDPGLESGFMIHSRLMDRSHRVVTDDARVSFWRAFNIDPATQLSIEGYFQDRLYHGAVADTGIVLPGLVI